MSRLAPIDWIIIAAFIATSITIGVILSRRGRRSVREYFTSGGSTPWWLLGTSMVATTFAADTPLTLAGWVVTKGIAQNWFWWCQVPITMLGVFFIARLWRRSELVTDMELVYIRYSGRSADVLRGFKAAYFALVYGCLIIGWVNLAMTKIIQLTLPNIPRLAVVDEALLWTYLHTPVSNEVSPEVRSAMRSGGMDPLELYYDDWELDRHPERHAVLAEVELALKRLAVIEKKLAHAESPQFQLDRQQLQEYAAEVGREPFLARLGLEDRLTGLAPLIRPSTDTPASATVVPADLRILYDVNQAVCGVNKFKIILLLFVIVIAYTAISGLWGVLVTDFVQFWIAMVGCVALAFLAVRHLGGMDEMLRKMAALYGAEKSQGMVGMIPVQGSGDLDLMPWSHFLVFIFFMWYVTGPTDGGMYFAQRMLSAKNERHAALGYLWYSAAHYCLRMWPWLIVGCAAAVMFPYTCDAVTGEYPGGAVAENGYIKVMLAVLPSGLLGMVLASFLAAFMSTISTQLNLGASYLLNDLYRPFVRKQASERHYVIVSQIATVLMALIGLAVSLFYTTISDAWFLIGTLSAGTGFIYLLRWFWWRVNAWTELSCLVSLLSLVVVVSVFDDQLGGLLPPYPLNLLILVPYSVGIALVVTYLTRPVAPDKLAAFARKVQPGGPGWRRVEAEIRKTDPGFRSHSPLQWANAGRCAAAIASVYCLLFGVGKLMVGEAFRTDAWIPNRVIGGVLVGLGVVLGWLVARSFSQRRWAAADAK
ncbi:MAG: Na+:solute symporter [Phycisphaerales bacterium]|nr:MAG: Na+:solute symporter [Phycisphaerales bacterium]